MNWKLFVGFAVILFEVCQFSGAVAGDCSDVLKAPMNEVDYADTNYYYMDQLSTLERYPSEVNR